MSARHAGSCPPHATKTYEVYVAHKPSTTRDPRGKSLISSEAKTFGSRGVAGGVPLAGNNASGGDVEGGV